MIKDYTVYFGDEKYQVKAKSNRDAAYRAARLCKTKYGLKCSLSDIVYYARTHLTPELTFQEVLANLKKYQAVRS